VNYWMHNGFVNVDKEKMSESLGNFFTIREVLKKYDAEVVRFFILRAHYRSPLNYSDVHLDDAEQSLNRLYTALKSQSVRPELVEGERVDWNEPYAQRFQAAMDDDFNTPEAMAVLFDLANQVNRTQSVEAAAQLKTLGATLGLLQDDPIIRSQRGGRSINASVNERATARDSTDAQVIYGKESIDRLIAERTAAKQAKNFAEADRIRKELLAAGIVLEDSAAGTTWRRA